MLTRIRPLFQKISHGSIYYQQHFRSINGGLSFTLDFDDFKSPSVQLTFNKYCSLDKSKGKQRYTLLKALLRAKPDHPALLSEFVDCANVVGSRSDALESARKLKEIYPKDVAVNAVYDETNKHWNEIVPQAVEEMLAARAKLPDNFVKHRWLPARPLWEYDDASKLAKFKDTTYELQERWKDLKTSFGADEIEIVSFNMYAIHTGDIENVYNLPSGLTIPMTVGGQWKLLIENNDRNELAKGYVTTPDDIEQIVSDQHSALSGIYQQIKTQTASLSVPLLHSTHTQMLRNCHWYQTVTEFGDKVEQIVPLGEFKIAPNHHGLGTMYSQLHEYCPPNKVEDEINNIIKWLSDSKMKEYDAVSIASWLHHSIVATHPYADGNGRISRFASSLVLLTNNLPPAVIQRPSKLKYINGLILADLFRVERFTTFLTKMIDEHIQQCKTLVEVKQGALEVDLWARKDIDQLANDLQKNGGK